MLRAIVRQEVFSHRREDIDQNHFFIQHRRAVPAPRRKVEHVAGVRDPLVTADGETHTAAFHQRDLFVGVIVRGRNYIGREAKAAEHQVVADNELPLNPFLDNLHWHGRPVHMLSRSV